VASLFAGGLALLLSAGPGLTGGPAGPMGEAPQIPTAGATDSLQAARAMMRALREPSGLVCGHEHGLHTGDGPVACPMYAPGYRPRRNGEDTPNIGNADEFNIANPNWKWPQPGGLGTPATITYSYSNLLNGGLSGVTTNQLQSAVQEALAAWAAHAPLVFIEQPDAGPPVSDNSYSAAGTPNLRFGHHAFDGPSGTLAHAYYPSSQTDGIAGDVHFDNAESWAMQPGPGKIDFLEVCVHEIGHALGLGHQQPPPVAIMNPFYGSRYSGLGTAFLFPDDINGIQALYVTGAPPGGCFVELLVQQTKKAVQKTLPVRWLGAAAQPEPLLKDLRWFRDTVLQRTDVGRQLTVAYYRHGPEVFAAIAEQPALAGEALALVTELRSSLTKQGRIQPNLTLSQATYDRGLAWLDRVQPLVSDDAQAAIASVRQSLAGITRANAGRIVISFEDAAP
jgi:hypothetical protein